MGWRTSLVACVLFGCGASPARWSPPEDLSAEDAVLYVSTGSRAIECTGVLVGESSALTAAHCVSDPGPIVVRVGSRRVSVRACAVHPDAYAEPRPCGAGPGRTNLAHDLAVLSLADAVDVSPVPLLLTAPEFATRWWSGRAVRLVGWDRRPRFVGPLARRSGINEIVGVRDGGFTTVPPTRGGFRTIIGDSGGPALLRIGGVERVAGVLGGGTAPGSRESVFVATFEPQNASWLLETLPSEIARDLVADDSERFGPPPLAPQK